MRKWLAKLTNDPAALADLLAHLDELRVRELEQLLDRTKDATFHRGVVEGISIVRSTVTLNASEESARARFDSR
jgi:hypothetical protein